MIPVTTTLDYSGRPGTTVFRTVAFDRGRCNQRRISKSRASNFEYTLAEADPIASSLTLLHAPPELQITAAQKSALLVQLRARSGFSGPEYAPRGGEETAALQIAAPDAAIKSKDPSSPNPCERWRYAPRASFTRAVRAGTRGRLWYFTLENFL